MSHLLPENYSLRSMTARDLTAVAALERLCHAHPWSAQLFQEELSHPHSSIDLLWHGTHLAGYACSWQVCDELHVLNVAVAPDRRRQGLGRQLLEHILNRARANGCVRALLEVRVGNAGAIALYRAFDFKVVGSRSGYYADGEDALVMERDLAPG